MSLACIDVVAFEMNNFHCFVLAVGVRNVNETIVLVLFHRIKKKVRSTAVNCVLCDSIKGC